MEKVKRDVLLLGRLILGGYLLMSGYMHFMQAATLTSYAAAKGVPYPEQAVLVTGALLIVAGATILLGFMPGLGVLSLVAFFVPVTFMMHAFWRVSDPAMRAMELVNFSKNLGLLGAGLMFLGVPTPWPLSLGAKLRPFMPRALVLDGGGHHGSSAAHPA